MPCAKCGEWVCAGWKDLPWQPSPGSDIPWYFLCSRCQDQGAHPKGAYRRPYSTGDHKGRKGVPKASLRTSSYHRPHDNGDTSTGCEEQRVLTMLHQAVTRFSTAKRLVERTVKPRLVGGASEDKAPQCPPSNFRSCRGSVQSAADSALDFNFRSCRGRAWTRRGPRRGYPRSGLRPFQPTSGRQTEIVVSLSAQDLELLKLYSTGALREELVRLQQLLLHQVNIPSRDVWLTHLENLLEVRQNDTLGDEPTGLQQQI